MYILLCCCCCRSETWSSTLTTSNKIHTKHRKQNPISNERKVWGLLNRSWPGEGFQKEESQCFTSGCGGNQNLTGKRLQTTFNTDFKVLSSLSSLENGCWREEIKSLNWMVGIVFYQKENKKWEKVGRQCGNRGRPRWRAGCSDGRSLPQRKRMPPANAATSMMTKGSFELVSCIRS